MIGDGDEVDNDDGDDDHEGDDEDRKGDDEDGFSLSQVLVFDLADPSICTGYVA